MVNWDKFLAYDTPKVVQIEDKTLGVIHHLLQIFIILYIVFFSFAWNKGYLAYESVMGIVRLSLANPDTRSVDDATYCTNAGGTDNNTNPLFCEVWSRYVISGVEDLSSSFFITTFVEDLIQTRTCTHWTQEGGYTDCNTTWDDIARQRRYVVNAELYKMTVAHNAFAPSHAKGEDADSSKYKGSSQWMDGEFIQQDGTSVPFPKGSADTYSIQHLLDNVQNSPGVRLDDHCTDFACRQDKTTNETYREHGMVLIVKLEYSNDYGVVSPNDMRYKVSVDRMLDATYSISGLHDLRDTEANQSRAVRTRRGVRLDFVQQGNIGKFNFPQTVALAISSAVLLKMAAVCVDIFATRMMKSRRAYKTMILDKFESTEVQMRKVKARKPGRDTSVEGDSKPDRDSGSKDSLKTPLLE